MSRVVHIRSSSGFFGAERVIVTLLKHLAALGDPVTLLVLEDHRTGNRDLVEAAAREGIETRLIPCRGPLDRRALAALTAGAGAAGAGLVHTHDVKSNLYGRLVARRLACPVVATLHGRTSDTPRMRLYEWLDDRLLRGFDGLAAVSEAEVGRLRRAVGSRVRYVPNGVDVERFRPDGAGFGRAHWGIDAERFVFGTFARFTPEKGHELLLTAFAELAARHPRVTLLLLGDGPGRTRMQARAAELLPEDRVRFGGACGAVERALHDIDCYVSPSHTEGMPMIVLEAMASAVPVIATEVGAVGTVLADGAGLVVPAGDRALLAAAMEKMAAGAVALPDMGLRARERAVDRFGAEAQARAYDALYREMGWRP